MFEIPRPSSVDQILVLMEAFRADARADKVDLVVGVYKDDAGNVPIMAAVKAAEARLVDRQTTKSYVGIAGDATFRAHAGTLLFGEGAAALTEGRVATLQTPGGSAALRVGFDLLASYDPSRTVWVSTPTWANHVPVAHQAGLRTAPFPYFRSADRRLDFGAMMDCLRGQSKPGDVIVLHACCHNPTGVDLSIAQWRELSDLVIAHGLMPFVDCAYQGMGDGLEADVEGLRHMAEHVPELLVASSFSKNFGLYNERVGALSLLASKPRHAQAGFAAAEGVIRTNYSMPPNHGAAVVSEILSDPDLRATWKAELDEVRARITDMRHALRGALKDRQVGQDVSFLTDQKGMFSFTGFGPAAVETLRSDYGIYTAADGRMNVAALSDVTVDRVACGFANVLAHQAGA